MLQYWIPFGIIVVALIILLVLVIKYFNQLRVLNIKDIPKMKVAELKKSIAKRKVERAAEQTLGRVGSIFVPLQKLVKDSTKSINKKIQSIEDKYRKLKSESLQPEELDDETLKKMIDEAKRMVKDERYGEAEKRYIEILSHNPSRLDVYESLGRLYLLSKQLEQAEETLTYVRLKKPEDASVLTSLGEVALMQNNKGSARDYFEKAVAIQPNNPKYLDFFIQTNIDLGETDEAKKALSQLREVNPENNKLDSFKETIKEAEKKDRERMEKLLNRKRSKKK